MELSEDNLDIRKMQCLLDAAQVGWIEKESGGGRCRFSSLLGDALDLSNDTLSQNDFLQLVRTDFRSRVDASVLLSDHGDSKTAIEFPIAVSAGEQWVRGARMPGNTAERRFSRCCCCRREVKQADGRSTIYCSSKSIYPVCCSLSSRQRI